MDDNSVITRRYSAKRGYWVSVTEYRQPTTFQTGFAETVATLSSTVVPLPYITNLLLIVRSFLPGWRYFHTCAIHQKPWTRLS